MTLGDAATDEAGDGNGAAEVTRPDGSGASGAAEVTGPDGATAAAGTDGPGVGTGLRCGGGGGVERNTPGAALPGKMPRDEGGGGMREVGAALPNGRGTTLTGRGTTLCGEATTAEGAVSEALEALGSLSSPIENLAAHAPHHASRL